MKPNDLRLAWRVLLREPAYSAVAIFGMAVALAVCFLLLTVVRYASTYNDAFPTDGVVVVKERFNLLPRPDWVEGAPPPLRDVALATRLARDATRAKPFELTARAGTRLAPVKPLDYPSFTRACAVLAWRSVVPDSGRIYRALLCKNSLAGSREYLNLEGTARPVLRCRQPTLRRFAGGVFPVPGFIACLRSRLERLNALGRGRRPYAARCATDA